ncbi:hypothetical protein FHL15_009544 [Xylaria flabelliformis]|uniref:Uncharacterized protein n=1 Tax=Xylaria flabelliformis TaxID=2512241 RepID=A0A553HNU3_9PEZI|nr:hypothetical protein FHL15_009544 [Xylaria flabelliformis]
MSARFQLLRCLREKYQLLDVCMLDDVSAFFVNRCSATEKYENSDPAITLIECYLALMTHGGSMPLLLECLSKLAKPSTSYVDVKMPLSHVASKDKTRLHAYLALSLAKLLGRRDEAEKHASEAMQLLERMERKTEKQSAPAVSRVGLDTSYDRYVFGRARLGSRAPHVIRSA